MRARGSPLITGLLSWGLAVAARGRGDLVTARQQFGEAAAFFRSVGSRRMVVTAMSELAHGLRQQGQLDEAQALYRENLTGWQELGHRAALAHDLECLAFIAGAQGQTQRAARLFGAAEALRAVIDTPMTADERVEYDQAAARLREQMGAADFEAAKADGQSLTLDQAILYAMG